MKREKRFFNMVEVALAIAVVGLGIAGIMSLFPVALQASKNAVGDNYASGTADELLHYLGRECQKSQLSWEGFIGTSAGSFNNGFFKDASNVSSISNSDTADTNWDQSSYGLTGTNLYIDDNIGTDVWGIMQKSGDVEDFKAHMKIWKSKVPSQYWDSGGSTWASGTIPYDKAAALNIEISWPLGKPYSKRTKRYFYYEIYNPN